MATHSCSCLETPRDWGAWWAAVYGVAQSWTRLKWLSSSSEKKKSGIIEPYNLKKISTNVVHSSESILKMNLYILIENTNRH